MNFRMNEFETYEKYVALKLHFTSEYDYFRYNGKTSVTPKSFNETPENVKTETPENVTKSSIF